MSDEPQDTRGFAFSVPFQELLEWAPSRETLSGRLTDAAELAGVQKLGRWFFHLDTSAVITLEGEDVVVRFAWDAEQEARAKEEEEDELMEDDS